MSCVSSSNKAFPHEFSQAELVTTLTRLYVDGFNVVPVDKDKRPLLSWSWESRLEERSEERSRLTDLKSSKTEKLSSNKLTKKEGRPGRDE